MRLVDAVVLALIGTNCCCAVLPPDDCEPSQSSFAGDTDDDREGGGTDSAGLVTRRTSATGTGNDLAAILTGSTATVLLLVVLLTVACFWRRRRCISYLNDCWRACRDRGKAEQVKVTSLTGYSRSLPAAYCGVPASLGASECFDSDVAVRTSMTVLPPYSGAGRQLQSGSTSVVGDAMLQQLLPNASTSSSASSTSSFTWRPPTATSSNQRAGASTGPRDTGVPPAVWRGRPLPAPPTSLDAESSVGLGDDLSAVPRIDSDRLRHIDTLGAGHFGEVLLCELREQSATEKTCTTTSYVCQKVAVMTVSLDANQLTKTAFRRELARLCRLQHSQLVRLIGACCYGGEDRLYGIVVEYPIYGDLKRYLRQHTSGTTSRQPASSPDLTYGCLLYMAAQIASAMRHMEYVGLVHGDLAARNCLVGERLTVKVSDLGVARSLHSADYCRLRSAGPTIPLRWMAWESIVLGRYSTKSDVWSFGVTLWETLTAAAYRPYDWLSDEQLVSSVHHWHAEHPHQQPPSPAAAAAVAVAECPRELDDLMRQCWSGDEEQRPSFADISVFLTVKSAGFCPATAACHTDSTNFC